ncbi:radical SAM protein [Arabiibacter massiliensis]|uniref:radical SAM protein n=1 Tax=Arabiibacter massiliensis TaxID=1870985 RepID=UPI0009BB66EC|nr:radical SAM protein [Arabiibacter massiliensis]
MDELLATRPTLRVWLDEYAAIEREYRDALAARGIAFAPHGRNACTAAELRGRLHEHGARFLNGSASVSTGFLSSACAACVGDCGSRTFFISLRCNRDCYFCFNPNQADFEEFCAHDTPWRDDLDAFARSCEQVTHVGLTGGEPLLCRDEALAFFECAHELAPGAHLRLYTSGAGIDEAFCAAAVARGLSEVRFSVKLEDGEASIARALADIELARRFDMDVMVEMPVVPGTLERMERLLVELDARGVRGINLLEFCFPLRNWPEFERRGFQVKDPPFEVLYNYGYAGGLPIAGSEEASLALVEFALDEGLALGVHYCSLENKNRDQVLQMNRAVTLDQSLYELGEDCFYHVAKAFDGDVPAVRRMLDERAAPCNVEEAGRCVAFHPRWAEEAIALGTAVADSWNVVERHDGEPVVRELKLRVREGVRLR